jgi:hypothetical protein
LACLLAATAGAAGKADRTVLGEQAGAEALAAHGAQVAWALVAGQRVTFHLGAPGEASRQVTSVSGDRPVQVQAISFDGRYLAWSDDRFGNLESFVLDTQDGHAKRLSHDFGEDTDPDVADGLVAWQRGGRIWIHSLVNGTTWLFPHGAGQAVEPALAGGQLAFIRIEAARRTLVLAPLQGGAARTLVDEAGALPADPIGSGQVLVWRSALLRDAADPSRGFQGHVAQAMLLPDGPILDLGDSQAVAPAAGTGTRVAWQAPGQVAAFDLAAGHRWNFTASARALAVTDIGVSWTQPAAGGAGMAVLHEVWEPGPSQDRIPAAGILLALAGVTAAVGLRGRR